ncbi:MAG: Sir2 family NAD-dependent protein deacetylase [Bacillota bacterium]|jgi:NAD-dependent deacetylase
MDYRERIAAVAELIKTSTKTLALTGAGVSTESGIPDYRSPGTGLWEKMDPVKVSSLSALKRDPARFYDLNLDRWTAYNETEPNAAHLVLAKLEQLNLLLGVITQNIDSLHKKAGTVKLWEVHGHLRTCRCMDCGCGDYPFAGLVEQYRRGVNPPRCQACQNGVLRPDVVLFEDPMNEHFFHVTQILSGCQLLIVAGSSLTVYPVAGLPGASRRLVIVNNTPTPWDDRADIVLRESAGRVFTDILSELRGDGSC